MEGAEDCALFVAQSDDGKVVGYIQINLEPKTLLSDSRADISALIVHESCRSQGIGAALVASAEQWAADKGLNLIRVRSNTTREAAHRFYLRAGYRVSKTSSIFVKTIG
jgi:GNAT superfamily N-acetyltransferase